MSNPHTWVSLQFNPVNVEEDGEGGLTVSENKEAKELAQDQAMLGCWFCHVPLEVASFGTLCYPDEATSEKEGQITTEP